jgi:ribonuclease HI
MKQIWTPEKVNIFNASVDEMITKLPPNQAIAFTDGAYSQNKNKAGYGVVLFTQWNKETYDKVFRWNTQSHKEIIKLHNVGAECEAVKFIVKKAIEKNLQKITIFYDYEGILKWITREWNANQEYTKDYVNTMLLYSKQIQIGFVKVKSHCGIIYNELADEIATNALLKP